MAQVLVIPAVPRFRKQETIWKTQGPRDRNISGRHQRALQVLPAKAKDQAKVRRKRRKRLRAAIREILPPFVVPPTAKVSTC